MHKIGDIVASKIIQRRNDLYIKFLDLEKRKSDTRDYKARIEELDWIIGGCK